MIGLQKPNKIMKKKHLLFGFFATALLATFNYKPAISNIPSPDAGNSGDPVTTVSCARSGCHPSPAQTATTADLNLKIGTTTPNLTLNSSFEYTPGQQYSIGLSILRSASTNPFYGFQIVAMDASNNPAGTMVVTAANNTKINTLAVSGHTYQYMGHKTANSNRNWVFKWTAPAVSSGPVTFYYAFNVANASSAQPTDPEGTIYHNSVTIQEMTTGINDLTDKVADLTIFPNPVSSNFGLSFNLKETNQVAAQLYSLSGQMVKELINEKMSEGGFNQQFDINELPAGIYLVKMSVGSAWVTKKIVKI